MAIMLLHILYGYKSIPIFDQLVALPTRLQKIERRQQLLR